VPGVGRNASRAPLVTLEECDSKGHATLQASRKDRLQFTELATCLAWPRMCLAKATRSP
jgi:hypothetical protein